MKPPCGGSRRGAGVVSAHEWWGSRGGRLWVVRVGGDDGELRPWHYIYEGRRGRWGTPTMTLPIRIQHRGVTREYTGALGLRDQGLGFRV